MTRCILLVAVATKQFVSNLPFHHSSCLSSPRSTWINISVCMLYTCIYRLCIFSCFFCKDILSYSMSGKFFLEWSKQAHICRYLMFFSTVHHSIGLFLHPTLIHNSITACMSHYYPRHVSGLDMSILRKNNCTNTASGILALLSGCTLHRLTAELSTGVEYSRLEERGYQMLCLCSCSSWGWACQGPKHVEDSSVTYMLLLNCALKLVEEIILYYNARSRKQ